ncbi:hypothetical protein [Natronoarchaeum rubrum]|uniref:hypothetical protein n=1 Tax=Natronoarchaeum rubrum TaxID=755311 RepID=UPI002111995E|nr:hypothetical protein [Natronoarchaeum rubrum]
MRLTTSLRWALYYRGLALLSFLFGAVVAAAGVWVGLYDVVVALLELASGGSGNVSDALSASRPLAGGALVVLGFAVWQVGKTAAFYKTLTQATEAEMADRFDTQTVKSEILAALDEQLSDLHADVETTRRQVSRLNREGHADELVEDGVDAETGASNDDRASASNGADRGTASDGADRTSASNGADRTTETRSAESETPSSGTGSR